MTVTWMISDGSVVTHHHRGVAVEGQSALAEALRRGIASALGGLAPQVDIRPPPGGSIALDPANVWVIDRWLRALAAARGLAVTTTYEAPIGDAPQEAREILDASWDAEENVIY